MGTLHRVERGERWGGVLWVGRVFTTYRERGERWGVVLWVGRAITMCGERGEIGGGVLCLWGERAVTT